MNDLFPKIPVEEFTTRLKNFKEKMYKNNIDLTIVYSNLCDPSAVRYFADVSPINENIALVIPLEGEPILCSGQACHEWSAYNSKIKAIRIMPEVGEVAGTEYNLEGQMDFEVLFKELKSLYKVKKIGLIGELIIPYCITKKAERIFPDAEIVMAEKLLYELRVHKSENEITCIRKACDIISNAFTYAVPRAVEGVTELDIEADLTYSFLKQGAESACYALTPMIGSGAERSTLCQARNSLRKIKNGEITSTVGGCCYEGYNGVISTPIVPGKVPDEIKDTIKIGHECLYHLADHMKPGVTSGELLKIYLDFLKGKGGLDKYSPYGAVHSLGMIECEYPFFGPSTNTVMVENMTVAVDVYLKGLSWGSFRIEDTFVIRKDGAAMLTWFNNKYIPEAFR